MDFLCLSVFSNVYQFIHSVWIQTLPKKVLDLPKSHPKDFLRTYIRTVYKLPGWVTAYTDLDIDQFWD